MTTKYKNGKIYKLTSKNTKDVYIGSTIQLLCDRKAKHKYDYKRYLRNECNYTKAFEIIKYDDCIIELILSYPCENRKELESKEGEFIKNMKCNNTYIAGRTRKELAYYKYHNDKKYRKNVIQSQKKSYEKRKDKINAIKKQKYICDCGHIISRGCKARHNKTKYHRMNVHNILNHL